MPLIPACRTRLVRFVVALGCLALLASPAARACPFCSPPGPTLAEEMATAQVVVIAKLVVRAPVEKPADKPTDSPAPAVPAPGLPPAKFEIATVLKGQAALGETRTIHVLHVGDEPLGTPFFIVAEEDAGLVWSQPIAANERAQTYLHKSLTLPAQGVERLQFVLPYLEADEAWLREDAYAEFAKAPYAEVKNLREHLRRESLVVGIANPYLDVRLRRLYLTLLGICGTNDDLPLLEHMMATEDRALKNSLDAVVACYLTLRGEAGLERVEREILCRDEVEFNDVYSAVMALRFHGEEERRISRARLGQTLVKLLDHPETAELVIADLARWQDWRALDALTRLFEQSTGDEAWIRVAIVQYFHACPRLEAKEQLATFKRLDPQAVKLGLSPFVLARRPGESRLPPASNRDGRD